MWCDVTKRSLALVTGLVFAALMTAAAIIASSYEDLVPANVKHVSQSILKPTQGASSGQANYGAKQHN